MQFQGIADGRHFKIGASSEIYIPDHSQNLLTRSYKQKKIYLLFLDLKKKIFFLIYFFYFFFMETKFFFFSSSLFFYKK